MFSHHAKYDSSDVTTCHDFFIKIQHHRVLHMMESRHVARKYMASREKVDFCRYCAFKQAWPFLVSINCATFSSELLMALSGSAYFQPPHFNIPLISKLQESTDAQGNDPCTFSHH